jgi:hypothetical protein
LAILPLVAKTAHFKTFATISTNASQAAGILLNRRIKKPLTPLAVEAIATLRNKPSKKQITAAAILLRRESGSAYLLAQT